MWIIQNQGLLSLPDNAPLPPNSVKVDVPSDFHQKPHAYRIKGHAIVKVSAAELARLENPREVLTLTQKEIAKLKKAIAEGRL